MLVLSKTKKILIILLSVLLLITFSGCAEKTGDNDKAGGDIVSEGDTNLPGKNNENI